MNRSSPQRSAVARALALSADLGAAALGEILFREGCVHFVAQDREGAGQRVRGTVRDGEQSLAVSLLLRGTDARGSCECGRVPGPCGHQVALARAWASRAEPEPADGVRPSWRSLLQRLVSGPAAAAPPGRRVLVHSIELVRRGQGLWALALAWRVHRVGARGLGPGRLVRPARVREDTVGLLGPADERILEVVLGGEGQGAVRVEAAGDRVDTVLRRLARAPWVRWEGSREPATFDLRPAELTLGVTDLGEELRVEARWAEGPEGAWCEGPVRVLGTSPPWIECRGVLRPVHAVSDGPTLERLLEAPLSVPAADLPSFLGTVVPQLEERGLAVELGGVAQRDLVAEGLPRPRLYLSEQGNRLQGDLRFAYGDYEIAAENPSAVVAVGPRETRVFVRRDMEFEFQSTRVLRGLGFQMAEPGHFELDGEAALDFLFEKMDELAEQWDLFGRDDLRRHRVQPDALSLGVRLAASIDWLDLHAEILAGGEVIPMDEVLRAFRRGSRYVRLGRGAHAALPREWLERVGAALDDLGLDRGSRRVPRHLAPLVAGLLDEASRPEVEGGDAWERLWHGLRERGGVPDYPLPTGLCGELRPYQVAGYRWLRFLEEQGLAGILADDMGLGKTVQTLALLLAETEGGRQGPSLVVAPTSVVPNWEAEACRFAPGLRVARYQGSERRQLLGELGGSHLVVTSYATLRRDVKELEAVAWNYVILDEGQAIKNAATQTARAARRLKARRRLTLTGTPIENHLGELWSQFQFLLPGLLGTERRFAERFGRPIAQGDERARESLRKRIRPFVLRRLKGEVASELPEKVESLLLCQMGAEQERLYRSLLEASRERVFREVAERGVSRSRLCILDALLRLRQACCHPEVLPGDLGRDVPSAKFDLFRDFVAEIVEEGHRVLVFSQFVKVLEILRRWFEEAGIPHLYLDGRTRDREARVRRFQEDDSVAAFLVSLKAGGTGLNLTGADYVLLYDPWWNPAVESQATDRAHRIGQTRKVFSYKLITQGTVEEKILALQDRKRGLTEDLLRSEDRWSESLTAADLEYLLGD